MRTTPFVTFENQPPFSVEMLRAASSDSVDELERLAESGADLNAVGEGGMTPLMWAVKRGSLNAARFLAGKFGLEDATPRGDTLLMLAARAAQLEMAEWLLPQVNAREAPPHGWTALMAATLSGSAEMVSKLLPGSDAKARNEEGWTALMFAAKEGPPEMIAALLPHSDANACDKHGRTALMHAASGNRPAAVRVLLTDSDLLKTAQLEMSPKNSHSWANALAFAITGQNWDCVELLATPESGKARDEKNNTLLMLAAEKRAPWEILSVLLRACDPKARGAYGETVLHVAATRLPVEVVARLLPHCDLAARNDLGRNNHSAGQTAIEAALGYNRTLAVADYLLGQAPEALFASVWSQIVAGAFGPVKGADEIPKKLPQAFARRTAIHEARELAREMSPGAERKERAEGEEPLAPRKKAAPRL